MSETNPSQLAGGRTKKSAAAEKLVPVTIAITLQQGATWVMGLLHAKSSLVQAIGTGVVVVVLAVFIGEHALHILRGLTQGMRDNIRGLKEQQRVTRETVKELRTAVDASIEQHERALERLRTESRLYDVWPRFGDVCRDARRFGQGISATDDAESLRREISRLLRELVNVFSELSGHECAASIKMVYFQDGQEAVQTLTRSSSRVVPPATHYVDSNTDFHAIMKQGHAHWFSNDVTALADYRNTSPGFTYRSTIVWPLFLTHRTRDEQSGRVEHHDAIVGFLCVDSDDVDAFDRARDVALGFSFLDVLSMIIDRAYDSGALMVSHPASES